MTSKDLDRLARGPDPRARVAPPLPGERCPRCHRVAGRATHPCLLCAPALAPYEHRTDLRRAAIDAARLGGIAGWIARGGAS